MPRQTVRIILTYFPGRLLQVFVKKTFLIFEAQGVNAVILVSFRSAFT